MIQIIKPGLLSSIQDLGRRGFQKYGVITSGAMDFFAHRVANILVGNEENVPTMEATLIGPEIKFEEDSLISVCGGNLSPSINNIPISNWRPILIKKGSILTFGMVQKGCRAYLSVAGGFKIAPIMKSRSTYLRAQIGGYKGRRLEKEDRIPIDIPGKRAQQMMNHLQSYIGNQPFKETNWTIAEDLFPYSTKNSIRVLEGRHHHLFDQESQYSFFHLPFKITNEADRMGYRLQGPSLQLMDQTQEMISEAVTFGTIQVPKDGNPIILMADRQTTGGYPKIGEIASVDLPTIAQAKPGDFLSFTKISLSHAQHLFIEMEEKIKQLKYGVASKYDEGDFHANS